MVLKLGGHGFSGYSRTHHTATYFDYIFIFDIQFVYWSNHTIINHLPMLWNSYVFTNSLLVQGQKHSTNISTSLYVRSLIFRSNTPRSIYGNASLLFIPSYPSHLEPYDQKSGFKGNNLRIINILTLWAKCTSINSIFINLFLDSFFYLGPINI